MHRAAATTGPGAATGPGHGRADGGGTGSPYPALLRRRQSAGRRYVPRDRVRGRRQQRGLHQHAGRFAGNHEDDPAARAALEAAGFRWIDGTTGSIRVTGLGVYYFGSRDPLSVDTLLFYWQD
ncbi:hypothetical protein WKI68_41865 [Streptomyces sp. MS1.HAVA.3]|uniref:Uncharacterized protein n=1 Tax=Streptomyces caledonius TaxID=3134107 RepID=A0ABU8UDM8_9ACTN